LTDRNSNEDEPRGLSRQASKAYQSAAEAVFAIPVAGGLGYWADTSFDTGPVCLLLGLVLGFVTFVMRLMRMRKLVEQAGKDASTAEDNEQ
jgi:F0F1-type ATP synthase assembly protein I